MKQFFAFFSLLILCRFQIFAQVISGGSIHSLILCDNLSLKGAGNNEYGELGDSSLTNSSTFVNSFAPQDIIRVSAGWNHSIAVSGQGSVWSWGWNGYGQLGDSSVSNGIIPNEIGFGSFYAVAGGGHSLAITYNDNVASWGLNLLGELGDGTTTDHHFPVVINGLNNVEIVAAGYTYSFAVKSDGTLWAWGDNQFGQLGNNSTTDSYIPIQVSGLTNIIDVANGGYGQSVALKDDSTVWVWGRNNHGQLGIGNNLDILLPAQIVTLNNVIDVECGYYHCLALKDDGTVWAWGYNGIGELGDSTYVNSNVPVKVNALSGIVAIDAGGDYSIAVKNDGTLWTWGRNNYGQLGDGTIIDKNYPVHINVDCFSGSSSSIQNPVTENSLEGNLSINQQSFIYSFTPISSSHQLRVIDLMGRIVYSESLRLIPSVKFDGVIDVSNLKAGMFFLQIADDGWKAEQIQFVKTISE